MIFFFSKSKVSILFGVFLGATGTVVLVLVFLGSKWLKTKLVATGYICGQYVKVTDPSNDQQQDEENGQADDVNEQGIYILQHSRKYSNVHISTEGRSSGFIYVWHTKFQTIPLMPRTYLLVTLIPRKVMRWIVSKFCNHKELLGQRYGEFIF